MRGFKYWFLGGSLLVFAVALGWRLASAAPEGAGNNPAPVEGAAAQQAGPAVSLYEFAVKHRDFDPPRGGYYNEGYEGTKVPVLCYHRIDSGARDRYYVTRADFEWQMAYLARHHTVISTATLVDYIRYQRGLSTRAVSIPTNAVVIQFDDNYQSVYSDAFPVLRRHKLPWTFFVYRHHHKPNPRAHLEVMARAGVDFQSHTMTHPWFHKPANRQSLAEYVKEMHWQIGGSKKYIEELAGRPVRYLAYPFGTWSDLAVKLCSTYGYEGLFCADGGYATSRSSPAAIERILVTSNWSKDFFIRVVQGKVRFARSFRPAMLISGPEMATRLSVPMKEHL